MAAAAAGREGAPAQELDGEPDLRDADPPPSVPGSGGSVADPDGVPGWLPPVLRMMAETQQRLGAVGDKKDVGALRSRTIANVHLDEFYGGRQVTSYQYRQWKKHVEVVKQLYQLTDTELAFAIYTQVKGEAKRLLEVLEIEDLQAAGSLELIWSLLDSARAKMAHERADDAYHSWESAHRRHGQSMGEWIVYLQKCKLELEAQDPDIKVSKQQLASKMLRGAGLPQEKRAQVLFNCGGSMTHSGWRRCCA